MRRRRLLVLAAILAVVVLVCQRPFTGGDGGAPAVSAPPPAPVLAPPPRPPLGPGGDQTAAPTLDTTVDPEPEEVSDGLVTSTENLDPARVPEAVRAAERFAQAWSSPDTDWPDGLAGLATEALFAALARAPHGPDAVSVTGPALVLLDAPEWARVGVPSDRGTIVLDVTMVDGRWLVSAVALESSG